FPIRTPPCDLLLNIALTGLVTQVFQPVSPRECLQPAPADRGAIDSDQNLRRFTFHQHDPDLPERRTE
ncbi:hypothetical protein, partial [Vreelandella rituensis]|uniref:hypothetical protein n=1 Tax=Vreelandella rituensis TaxID=2282306 RepID=UPI0039F04A4D